MDHLRHRGGWQDVRERIAGMHQLADSGETLADAPARMEVGKVFGFPSTAAAYFESQRVT